MTDGAVTVEAITNNSKNNIDNFLQPYLNNVKTGNKNK